jgi:hypothetical protein
VLTRRTQRWLASRFDHDCAHPSKGIKIKTEYSGIGSLIHTTGWALAVALKTNRIASYHNLLGSFYGPGAPEGICAPGQGPGFRCAFLPPSRAEALGLPCTDSWEITENLDMNLFPQQGPDWVEMDIPNFGNQLQLINPFPTKMVPEELLKALESVGHSIPKDTIHYWWRAQSAAYMLRLAPAFKDAVRQTYLKLYPPAIPAGCVSVHVRLGDKVLEAAPSPITDYWDAAIKLIDQHPLRLGRCIVLTTGVLSAVEWFSKQTKEHGVRLIVADIPRIEEESFIENSKLRAPFDELILSFAHLVASIQADAFVGTLTSNWCRLVDELRSTVAGKALAPFVDLHADRNHLFAW